ncbi:outer membrane protein assembly factor BamD, partial [Neisseria sp. P0001.S008]
YKKLDKPHMAADTRRVLETNFPQSQLLQHEWRSDDMPCWRYWR